MEDVNQLFDAAFEFAHYPGAQNEASVKEFLDRFPLPVIFNALQTDPDIPGFENTLVTCLERLFKTKYGASLIPQYMPVLQVGLKADSAVVKSLACKTVLCLLENCDTNDVSPVQLVVNNGIYPLLLDYIINSDDEVANAASETIKSLARFPDAMSVIFPSETNDATHIRNLAARCSSLARVRVLSLIVKLFSISRLVASEIKKSGLLDLLEAEMKGTKDTLVILNVLELYYELMEVEHSSEFVPQTSLIQLLCSIISGTSTGPYEKLRAMMISGRLLSKENIYKVVEEASVKALISAIDGSLESVEMNDTDAQEAAIDALGQIGSTTKGADLVLSTSPPAARHVVASAFDRNAHGKQLAALHALANITGETRPKSNRIVDGKAEESLRCLIYDVAAQSTKLTPSGLFLSVLQQSSEIRLAGYRTLTALVARPWCLVEILSKEEIINIVTDATTETAKIAMEARYNCCKAIHKAFLCSNFVDDPHRQKTGEKLQEAVRSGPYMSKKHRGARPEVMTGEGF
ncbi:26S proteasome non-ATPase regulatory subunit 5 [Arabidopsis suecica]|uniref:26S proteasome non-ATPase regulatory subunit 5 n=1 Tax=Arabidopsis suecica TaxID=45249 RepID=A0A8T2BA30_ARASU|nr:26S proteasome non-ATPase regulatory subunit 5 [Arabidopsis suecica]